MKIKQISNTIQGKWYAMDDEKRRKIKIWLAGGALLCFALGSYYGGGIEEKREANRPEPINEIDVFNTTGSMLEDDIRETVDGDLSQKAKKLEETVNLKVAQAVRTAFENREILPLNNAIAEEANDYNEASAQQPPEKKYPPYEGSSELDLRSIPPTTQFPASNPLFGGNAEQPEKKPSNPWVMLGDVESVAREPSQAINVNAVNAQKNDNATITLPVGFMKAKLLTGITAMSGEFGQNNPQQVTFRVQAPAQLPNSIKMQLKGCFAIANAFGNLATERINVLPVSMNCVTMDGKKMISGTISGYVTDTNSMRDLKGRVVAKAGTLLARSVLINSVDTLGKALTTVDDTTVTTAFGTTGAVTPKSSSDKIKEALSESVGKGTSDVSKFLLNLAKQTTPVIEHGAGKTVYMYLVKPAKLKIEEL